MLRNAQKYAILKMRPLEQSQASAAHMEQAIRDFLFAVERDYFPCEKTNAFIDDLRASIAPKMELDCA